MGVLGNEELHSIGDVMPYALTNPDHTVPIYDGGPRVGADGEPCCCDICAKSSVYIKIKNNISLIPSCISCLGSSSIFSADFSDEPVYELTRKYLGTESVACSGSTSTKTRCNFTNSTSGGVWPSDSRVTNNSYYGSTTCQTLNQVSHELRIQAEFRKKCVDGHFIDVVGVIVNIGINIGSRPYGYYFYTTELDTSIAYVPFTSGSEITNMASASISCDQVGYGGSVIIYGSNPNPLP